MTKRSLTKNQMDDVQASLLRNGSIDMPNVVFDGATITYRADPDQPVTDQAVIDHAAPAPDQQVGDSKESKGGS